MKTDSCCREHDHCPLSISANQTKYGLHNELPYTRLAPIRIYSSIYLLFTRNHCSTTYLPILIALCCISSSNCACDEAFYKCLHNVNSTMPDTLSSVLIGNIFFTFLETRCFQKVPPYAACQIDRLVVDTYLYPLVPTYVCRYLFIHLQIR